MLCMECDGIVAPSAWRGKVLLVNGKIIDECVKDGDLDHWHRASFSHAVAVAHAALRGRDVVAVIEDDARSDFTVSFDDDEFERLRQLVRPDLTRARVSSNDGVDTHAPMDAAHAWSWNFLRFGTGRTRWRKPPRRGARRTRRRARSGARASARARIRASSRSRGATCARPRRT